MGNKVLATVVTAGIIVPEAQGRADKGFQMTYAEMHLGFVALLLAIFALWGAATVANAISGQRRRLARYKFRAAVGHAYRQPRVPEVRS